MIDTVVTRDMVRRNVFIEVEHYLERKAGQNADGDVFLSQKNPSGSRIVTALSDGLGSGIKANVLACLTAVMLIEFVLKDIPLRYAAELIINSLPVCSKRGLSYATFTLVDARHDMSVRFLEYENPPFIIIRGNNSVELEKEIIPIERKHKKTGPERETLLCSKYTALPGDRIVFFSDGVTQAGIGRDAYPGGWGLEQARDYTLGQIENCPLVSARDLAKSLVTEAGRIDCGKTHDDISCGVVYFREPRDLLVITGPPFHSEDDQKLARIFSEFTGGKVILGGTTAKIIARELNKTIESPDDYGGGPALSIMDGADLVCEGILTLGTAAKILYAGAAGAFIPAFNLTGAGFTQTARDDNFSRAAARFIDFLLNNDRITFVVGTKINEVHHDPTMPVELEIRRSVIKRIAVLLEEKYMKQVHIQYI
jgi:hypothetical protein